MIAGSERAPAGAIGAVTRALVAALVMGLALALATWAGAVLGLAATADHALSSRIAVAGSVTVVVVTLMVFLSRGWDRAPLRAIGLTRTQADLGGFFLGAGVILAAGSVVIAALTVFGAANWSSFDLGLFATFLITNAIVAMLLEAIPEEISIRGYALTALRRHFSKSTATVLNIAAFILAPLVALNTQALLERVLGDTQQAFAFAPGGEDPLLYYVTLTVFGLMLIHARDATASATIWTCVGAHLAWLTVNRIVLGQANGIQVELGEIATLVFFAAYVTAAIYAFSWLKSRQQQQVSDH